jgi:hypothetical protein
LIIPLLIGACRDERPPPPTAEQSTQLNEAENMLNAEEANEEGPKTNASEPAARAP